LEAKFHDKNDLSPHLEDAFRGISFHYGFLLYLKEELLILKNKSFEYFTKIEEFVNLFLFFSEGLAKIAKYQLDYLKNIINKLLTDKSCLKKYETLAISLCSHIFDEIDKMCELNKDFHPENIKNHIRSLFQEIQYMVSA